MYQLYAEGSTGGHFIDKETESSNNWSDFKKWHSQKVMEVEQGFRTSDFSTVAVLYNHQGNLLNRNIKDLGRVAVADLVFHDPRNPFPSN